MVLAAGRSSRTAPRHKLLARDASGTPMIARTLAELRRSRVTATVVVLGHRADDIRGAAGADARFVTNPDPDHGLSSSLRAGLAAAMADDPDGVLVCLGDMPLVRAELIDRVLDTWSASRAMACQPTHGTVRGHPVLWSRDLLPRLTTLQGDQGARSLLDAPDVVVATCPGGPACVTDFDTPDRLDAFASMP
nr:nucleotidyltransferase family protein [Ameyamaea chiangmaiensis]